MHKGIRPSAANRITCTPWDGHAHAILCCAMLMLCSSFPVVLNIGLLQIKLVPWDEHANAILCYATMLMLCSSLSKVLNIGLPQIKLIP